jgi:hypothetical protein
MKRQLRPGLPASEVARRAHEADLRLTAKGSETVRALTVAGVGRAVAGQDETGPGVTTSALGGP